MDNYFDKKQIWLDLGYIDYHPDAVKNLHVIGGKLSDRKGLNRQGGGLSVTAFALVILERHGQTQSDAFENAAAALPEVTECFSVSGDADYVLRIVAPDLQAFSELMMKRVLRLPGVAHIKSNIALQKVKQTHVLPLDHVAQLARPRAQLRYEDS